MNNKNGVEYVEQEGLSIYSKIGQNECSKTLSNTTVKEIKVKAEVNVGNMGCQQWPLSKPMGARPTISLSIKLRLGRSTHQQWASSKPMCPRPSIWWLAESGLR